MQPNTRVAKFLESCDPATTVTQAREMIERMVAQAENDALLGASIELENNHFPRFTQSDAAYLVRQRMRRLP